MFSSSSTFISWSNLNIHRLIQCVYFLFQMKLFSSPDKRLQCSKCSSSYSDTNIYQNQAFKQHVSRHGLEPRLAHACPHCDWSCDSKIGLGTHLNQGHTEKGLYCFKVDRYLKNMLIRSRFFRSTLCF